MNVGENVLARRCNPDANVIVSPIGQGDWAFDDLEWHEWATELPRGYVQQPANLKQRERMYLHACKH